MMRNLMTSINPYLEKKMLITLSMGFVSGVPLLLTITLLQAWLTDEGVSKSTIGLFALVGLPYSLKFIWAPLFDHFTVSSLGRRRGWLLITQVLLIISIIVLGLANPAMNPFNVAVLATLVAFSSASQDIVIDAYRRESLTDEEQTIGASAYVLGYRIGALAAGAGGLILADYMTYQMVYAFMSIIMIYGVFITLIAEEPKKYYEPSNFISAIYNPFVEFFNRHVSINIASDRLTNLNNRSKISRRNILNNTLLVPILILLFILLYKIGDTMAHSLSTNFYLDIGFSKSEIGTIVKFFGLFATLVGAFIGACSGSVGGGIKSWRILIMLKHAYKQIFKIIHPDSVNTIKLGKKVVDSNVSEAVWGFFSIYIISFMVLFLLVLATGLDFISAFSAVGACLNNLGPGLGEISSNYANIPSTTKLLLSFAMILGRLEIFTFLVVLMPAFWRR